MSAGLISRNGLTVPPVHPHFVVNVIPCCPPRRARVPDQVAALHGVSRAHGERREVAVACGEAEPVVDLDEVPVGADALRLRDEPGRGRVDRLARPRGDVDGGMVVAHPGEGIPAIAVRRRHPAVDRPERGGGFDERFAQRHAAPDRLQLAVERIQQMAEAPERLAGNRHGGGRAQGGGQRCRQALYGVPQPYRVERRASREVVDERLQRCDVADQAGRRRAIAGVLDFQPGVAQPQAQHLRLEVPAGVEHPAEGGADRGGHDDDGENDRYSETVDCAGCPVGDDESVAPSDHEGSTP